MARGEAREWHGHGESQSQKISHYGDEINMTHLLCQGFSTTKYQHFKELAGSGATKNNLLPSPLASGPACEVV